MDKGFTYTPISGRDDILVDIAKFEKELSQKIGEDIVLIAYSKKESRQS